MKKTLHLVIEADQFPALCQAFQDASNELDEAATMPLPFSMMGKKGPGDLPFKYTLTVTEDRGTSACPDGECRLPETCDRVQGTGYHVCAECHDIWGFESPGE